MFFGAFGGTLGYGYILNAPKNTILPASFIGLAGYIVYILLGMAGFGTMSAYFFSTVFVSVVCELLARKMRTPSTIFLLGALVPLVPGYNFYLAMLALVENLQREDLDPVEEALGIRELMTRCDLTQEQAARKLGKSRSVLANSLRLLNLPETVLELLKGGFLTTGHAKVVLGLPTPELQEQAAQIIADHELNVRQAEALCKKLAKPPKEPVEPAPRGTLPVEVEESLKQALGSEVNVAYHDGKGKLTVHFYSDEQLKAFANLLGQYQVED